MVAGETPITIVGNLVEDPTLRFTPGGHAVVSFRIASTPRFFDKAANAWKDGESIFLTVRAWRTLAENVAESLSKGQRAIVQGRLAQRSYQTEEGQKRTVYEVEADDIGPSLQRATARVERVDRGGGREAFARARGEVGREQDPWETS
ncbi:hypothetical protein GCM10022221_67790 [Actinocorallia aurea]